MAEVVFIGTGDAFGSGARRNSAILVRQGRNTLLLDCGPTTLMGLKSLGIDPLEIDAIAVSHFHGDHFAGLPFLLLDYCFENPRERPLQILGPPGTEERLAIMMSTFEYACEKPPFPIRVSRFVCGEELKLQGFTLQPFPAVHTPETRPHMLRVQAGTKSLFFTGDTGWSPELPGYVGNVDLFISECVYMERRWEYHLSHEELERERDRFTAGRTLLTHLGSEVLDNLQRLQFDIAHDGLRVKL